GEFVIDLSVLKYYGLVRDFGLLLWNWVNGTMPPAARPVEGSAARIIARDDAASGFTIPLGWSGSVMDAGVEQQRLGAGQYGGRRIRKLIVHHALGPDARIVLWSKEEVRIRIRVPQLFASDHQQMELSVDAQIQLNPGRLVQDLPSEDSLDL